MENSPFNELSAELRIAIYELVLVDDRVVNISISNEPLEAPSNPKNRLALTETCKQMRAETMPIFLGCNGFFFDLGSMVDEEEDAETEELAWGVWSTRGVSYIKMWLSRLENFPNCIKYVVVALEVEEFFGAEGLPDANEVIRMLVEVRSVLGGVGVHPSMTITYRGPNRSTIDFGMKRLKRLRASIKRVNRSVRKARGYVDPEDSKYIAWNKRLLTCLEEDKDCDWLR